jgi:hypothetical protein
MKTFKANALVLTLLAIDYVMPAIMWTVIPFYVGYAGVLPRLLVTYVLH